MLSHDIHLRSGCEQTCSTVVPAGTETGMSFTNNSTGGGSVGASVEAFIHPSGSFGIIMGVVEV